METLQHVFTWLLHLDEQLIALITTYGAWIYVLLFVLIFFETAIILAAFLPGDSLLFASGALAANAADVLNIHFLFFSLVSASVIGNGVNYFSGKWLGPVLFRSENTWFFNKKHIDDVHNYYARYGGKTIIIARFIPIVRTIAPFIAGIGYMTYPKFFVYNLIGALVWLGILLYGSYLFGNIPIVKQHFSLVLIGMIILSITPAIIEIFRRKLSKIKE